MTPAPPRPKWIPARTGHPHRSPPEGPPHHPNWWHDYLEVRGQLPASLSTRRTPASPQLMTWLPRSAWSATADLPRACGNPFGSGGGSQRHEPWGGAYFLSHVYDPLLTSLDDRKTGSQMQRRKSLWRSLSPTTDKTVRSVLISTWFLFGRKFISIMFILILWSFGLFQYSLPLCPTIILITLKLNWCYSPDLVFLLPGICPLHCNLSAFCQNIPTQSANNTHCIVLSFIHYKALNQIVI